MDEPIYKIIQLTGTSATSSDDAVRNALARAAKTVRHLRWFEVVETRGSIENGQIARWQVTLRIGFHLEE